MKKTPLALMMAVTFAAGSAAAQESYETYVAPVEQAYPTSLQTKTQTIPDTDDKKLDQVEDARTLEQKVPASVTRSAEDNVLTLTIENDLFSGEDKNYTSGVRATYLDVSSDFPEFAKDLAEVMPGFEINDTSSLFYSIGQNIYTPRDTRTRDPDPQDRPYAGYLYGSMGMFTYTDDHTDEIELSVGVVGPAALGEQAQKLIHRHLTNSPMPKGWSHQLKNEPAVGLGWQRTWPDALGGEIGPLYASVAPYVGATAGNVYTYADTGFTVRVGPGSERWQDAPARVRPAMPGTGFFEIPEDKWSWYLFGGVEGRAVARNIFLDGNTFTDSPSVDKNWLVGDANAGLAVTYGKYRVSFTGVYRTEEFEDQDGPSKFGAVNVGYRF